MSVRLYTLTQLSRLFGVPQHHLIYLCEKGIVKPAAQVGEGRGSSRKFSRYNVFELAMVFRFRELGQSAKIATKVLRLLEAFSFGLDKPKSNEVPPNIFGAVSAADIDIILSEGRFFYAAFKKGGSYQKLMGSIDIKTGKRQKFELHIIKIKRGKQGDGGFGWPEGSRFGRVEISLSNVCRDLQERLAKLDQQLEVKRSKNPRLKKQG